MFPSCYPLIEALHIPDNHDKEERYVVVHGVPSYVSFCSLSKPWGKEMGTHALDSSTLSRFSVQPNCSTSNTCRSLAVPESWKVPVGLTCCPDGRRCAIITQNGHVAIFQDPQPVPQIVEAPFLEMQADESSFRTVIASENTLRGSSISWSPLNENALLYGYAVWLGQSCNTCTLYAHDVTTQSSWPVELTCATVTSLSYSPHHASRFVLCTPHDFVQVCDVRSPLAPQIALNGKDRGAIYHATHHPVDEYYIATCTPPRERAGWNSAPTNPAASSYHRNNNASFVYVWDIRQPTRAVRQTQLWGNQSIAGLRWLSEKDGNTRSVGFNAALVPTLVVAMHDTPYLSILHFEDLHPGLICNAVGRRSNGVEELSLLDGYESVCSESTSNRSSGGASRRSSHQTSTLRKSWSAFRLTSNATSLLNVENRYICVSPYPHTSARNLMQKKDSANDGAPDVPPSQTPTIHAITTSPYQRDRVLAVVSDCGDVVSLEVAPHAPLSLWYQSTFASALPLTAPDHRGFPLYSIQVTNGVVQMCSLNLSAETSGTRFVRRIQKGFLLDPYRNGEILHDEGNDDAALLFHWINMVHRLKRSQPNASSREDDVQPDSSQPLSGIGLSVGIIEFMSSVLKEVEDATNTNNYSDIVQDKDSTNSIAFLSPLLQNKIQFLLYLCGWSNVPLESEFRERAEILEDTYVTTHALGTHTHRSTETNVDSKNDHAQCTLGGTALGSSEVGWNDQDVRFGQADVLWPGKFLQKRELFERKVFMLVVTKRYLSARDLLLSRLHSIAPNGKEETSPRTACGTDSEASSYFLLSVLIESKAYLIACRNASSNVPSQHPIKDAVTSAIQNLPLPRYLAATVEVLLHRSSDSTTPNSNSLEDFSNTERTLWEKLCHLLPLYDVVGSLALRAFEEQGDPRHVIALLEQIQEWYRLSRHPLTCVSLCGFGNPQASELLQRYVDCHGDLQVVLAVAAFAAQGEDLSEKWAKWSGDYRMWCNNSGQCMHRCEMDLAYHEIQELHGTSALDKQEEVVRSRVRARTTLRCTSCSQPLGSPTKELASSCIPGNREHRGDFVRGRFRPFARAADDLSGGNLAPGTLCTNPLCRRPLPRCSVCLNPMGGGDRRDTASNNGAILGNTAHLTDTWFVWCTLCHHGGHKEHLQQWFAMNEMCPVDSCGCRCST